MMENHLYNNFHPFKLEFSNSWKKWHKEKSQIYKNHSIKMFLSYSLQFLVTTAILIMAIFQYVEGIIALGSIQFFVNTALNLRSNVMSLFDNVTSISIYSERVNVLNEFLYKKEKPLDNGELPFPNSFTIKFDKVWFKYPNTDNWILENCSFMINKGDKIAFVGLNGAGKTTIIKLLLRFYEVDDGYILINDIPISKYNKDDLYRNITSMFQDPITYNTTLQENITFSKIDSSESNEQLFYSYEFAGLKDLVQDMPKGLHTQIGKLFDEQGYVPSGGQAQKIALARAIYRNSEIMILDEPVASIDPETEYEIFTKAIKKWESKTIILISHRLSNVIHCDKIIVLQNGNVIESGSHKELMKEDGEYAKLFYTQAKKYIL